MSDGDWLVVDCRFSLSDSERGRAEYQASHIPGALYAHLDEHLSGPIVPGETGRHPLPDQKTVEATFSNWGVSADTQVVVYDDSGGSIAGRLWWMLHWQGHRACALLDGGWQAWQENGYPTQTEIVTRAAAEFVPRPNPALLASAADVEDIVNGAPGVLIDSRAPERYRGDLEPIDAVAGHIPGAVNADHQLTLNKNGRFLPPDELRSHFEKVLQGKPAGQAVFYCGSGVSAVANLIAMDIAGLEGARLYVGSWSDWITDPAHPIETGHQKSISRHSK